MSGKKAWGGRFGKKTDPIIEDFTASVHVDARLAQVDIRGSIAHARMLSEAGILSQDERDRIVVGLEQLAVEFSEGSVALDPSCEDIHMLVERRLTESIGPVAGKLHTARSRNDQVALDLRMWCRDAASALDRALGEMQARLVGIAELNQDALLPGYTHLQRAQPVTLAHHLLAYFWMLDRDRDRLADWFRRSNVNPLGAAALAGTSLPIDPSFTTRELEFDSSFANSMDAVSDRDFVIELAAICCLIMTHLSRISEEVVIWSTAEFGFIELDDSVATGSSIMPQKKNPDVAELTRARFGRVQGSLVALLTLVKGLPLAYMRDLQEDKPPVFDAVDTTLACLKAMERLLATTTFHTHRMAQAADDGMATATDLAEHMVRLGIPFREAHEVVGRLVRQCLEEERRLDSLSEEELRDAHPLLGRGALESLRIGSSLKARSQRGGPSPDAVANQIAEARRSLQSRAS